VRTFAWSWSENREGIGNMWYGPWFLDNVEIFCEVFTVNVLTLLVKPVLKVKGTSFDVLDGK
jgi:hypothetical protein